MRTRKESEVIQVDFEEERIDIVRYYVNHKRLRRLSAVFAEDTVRSLDKQFETEMECDDGD